MTDPIETKAAEMLSIIEKARAAEEAVATARRESTNAQAALLAEVAQKITDTYPDHLYCMDAVDGQVEVHAQSGECDAEHGWARANIRLSITPRYGVRYELDSLAPRHGEQFGADIVTADIGKLLYVLGSYLPMGL